KSAHLDKNPPKAKKYLANYLPLAILRFRFSRQRIFLANRLERIPMIRKIALIIAYLALAASPCFGQQWAEKMFKTTEHDFGTVARGSKAEFNFTFSNLYLDDVHIVTAYSSCGCTSVDVIKPTLKTYEEGIIRAVFNSPSFVGSRAA